MKNIKMEITINEKVLLILIAIISICVTATNLRPPTPYECFNKQIQRCNTSECRTQVIGFYRQSIRDIEEIKGIKEYEQRLKETLQ